MQTMKIIMLEAEIVESKRMKKNTAVTSMPKANSFNLYYYLGFVCIFVLLSGSDAKLSCEPESCISFFKLRPGIFLWYDPQSN